MQRECSDTKTKFFEFNKINVGRGHLRHDDQKCPGNSNSSQETRRHEEFEPAATDACVCDKKEKIKENREKSVLPRRTSYLEETFLQLWIFPCPDRQTEPGVNLSCYEWKSSFHATLLLHWRITQVLKKECHSTRPHSLLKEIEKHFFNAGTHHFVDSYSME